MRSVHITSGRTHLSVCVGIDEHTCLFADLWVGDEKASWEARIRIDGARANFDLDNEGVWKLLETYLSEGQLRAIDNLVAELNG